MLVKDVKLKLIIILLLKLEASTTQDVKSDWVKRGGNFKLNLNLKNIGPLGQPVRLTFQREGSDSAFDVLSLAALDLYVQITDPYKNRVAVSRSILARKANVTLSNCGVRDAGMYSCVQGATKIDHCGGRLYVLDLQKIAVALYGDVEISIDVSRITTDEPVVMILFLPENEHQWERIVNINKGTGEVNYNTKFSRAVLPLEGIAKGSVAFKLKRAVLSDSGFYGCFSWKSEAYLPGCGYQLIVEDFMKILGNLNGSVSMVFDVTRGDIGEPSVLIKYRPEGDGQWRTMLTVLMGALQVKRSAQFPREMKYDVRSERGAVDVTLQHLVASDSGTYSCFSGTSESYLKGCGYQLIVDEIPKIFTTLHKEVPLQFDVSKVEDGIDVVLAKFLSDHAEQWEEIMTISRQPLDLTLAAESSRYWMRRLDRGRMTVGVNLKDVVQTDSGFYACFANETGAYVPGCGFQIVIEDLPEIVTLQHRDITLAFDIDRALTEEPSVKIMFNAEGVDKWVSIVTVMKGTMQTSQGAGFTRQFHGGGQRQPGIYDLTLTNVSVSDSGYYGCFGGAKETYIAECGYQLIVEDIREISAFEHMNVEMLFHESGVGSTAFHIKFRRQGSHTFETILSSRMSSDFAYIPEEAYQGRIVFKPNPQGRIATMTIRQITLADTGDYRCFKGPSTEYAPDCGYRLIVYVEKSEDTNQVNTIEHHDADLVFHIVPLVPSDTHVTIKFQHKSADRRNTVVMVVHPFNLLASVSPDYAKRLALKPALPERVLRVRMTRVTVQDDGYYLCFKGESSSVVPKCGQKLNVFESHLLPVVTKPWKIFRSDTFTATCDARRLDFPDDLVSVEEITLQKRDVMQTEFFPFAIYKPSLNAQTNANKPSGRVWVNHTRGAGDPKQMFLRVTFTQATAEDSGEYECTSKAKSKAGSFLFHSLISLVTVRPHAQVDTQGTQTAPESSSADLLEIQAHEGGDVTMTFNISNVAPGVSKVRIKFCRANETAWTELLEATTNSSLPANESGTVDVTVRNVTKRNTGTYRCFADPTDQVISNCGYRLNVLALPVTATFATNEMTTKGTDNKATTPSGQCLRVAPDSSLLSVCFVCLYVSIATV
ncbi:hypothetical protein Btru_000571 [Bulinus truncatus]|nr:hypothetical protein Btru_000571 [Bulinus truncatus]